MEPKFAIGEKAILRSELFSDLPTTLVTVVDWQYDDKPHNAIDGRTLPHGYSYKVTPDPTVGQWWFQSALHKIPPLNQLSNMHFSELLDILKKPHKTAVAENS